MSYLYPILKTLQAILTERHHENTHPLTRTARNYTQPLGRMNVISIGRPRTQRSATVALLSSSITRRATGDGREKSQASARSE